MKGNVIAFDPGSNTGAISGHDGRRYDFATADWHGETRPRRGDTVDFIPDGQRAVQLYLLQPEYTRPGFWEFFYSPFGRASRSEYWLRYFLPVFAISIVLNTLSLVGRATDGIALSAVFGGLDGLFQLAVFWPGIAVLVKRIHDRDKTGWLVLLPVGMIIVGLIGLIISGIAGGKAGVGGFFILWGLVMLGISVWFFVEFGCLRGTIGANRFGPDPVRAH